MRSIRVETSAATILLTEAPEKKVKDRRTGEIATDPITGEVLATVGVVYIEDGESSLIKVTVPHPRPAIPVPAVLVEHARKLAAAVESGTRTGVQIVFRRCPCRRAVLR